MIMIHSGYDSQAYITVQYTHTHSPSLSLSLSLSHGCNAVIVELWLPLGDHYLY
jgi:hypothetical protein